MTDRLMGNNGCARVGLAAKPSQSSRRNMSHRRQNIQLASSFPQQRRERSDFIPEQTSLDRHKRYTWQGPNARQIDLRMGQGQMILRISSK